MLTLVIVARSNRPRSHNLAVVRPWSTFLVKKKIISLDPRIVTSFELFFFFKSSLLLSV